MLQDSDPYIEYHETWYGEAELIGPKLTRLICLVEPRQFPGRVLPKYYLYIEEPFPNGKMVVRTIKYSKRGSPIWATNISYDPDPTPPGNWRGLMQNVKIPVKLVKIQRKPWWERL